MRKNLTFAIMALMIALVACDKNEKPEETQEVKKLPSKIRSKVEFLSGPTRSDIYDSIIYQYDEKNHLIAIVCGSIKDTTIIAYNPNGTPAVYGKETFQYNGNQIICYNGITFSVGNGREYANDTLLLNDNKKLIKSYNTAGYYSTIKLYTHNTNGSIIKVIEKVNSITSDYLNETETNITYSDILSIWRHANIPEWFWHYRSYENNVKGYMPSFVQRPYGASDTCSYELDEDGYVKKWILKHAETNGDWISTSEYEYIPAK